MNSKQRSNLKKHARHYQIKKALLTTGITTLSVSGALLTSSLRTHAAEVPNEPTTNQVNSMESSPSGKNEVALHNHDTQSSVFKAEESEATENISNNNSAKDADDAETDNNTAQQVSSSNDSKTSTPNSATEGSAKTESSNNSDSSSTSETASTTNIVDDQNAEKNSNKKAEENKQLPVNDSKKATPAQPHIATMTRELTPDKFQIGDKRYTSGDAIDVSSFQSWMTQADFNYLKKIGIKTVIVKTTEGNVYTNPYAQNQIRMAKNAGMNVSVYHFVRFNNPKGARGEAQYAASVIKKMKLANSTLIFADIEAEETLKNNIDMKTALQAFWSVLNQQGFKNHGVYVGPYYQYLADVVSTVGKSKTWLAQYPYTPVKGGSFEKQWKESGYGAWQFSSTAMLRGHFLDVSHSFNNLLTASSSIGPKNGQRKENGSWYLYKNGKRQTGLQYIANQKKTVFYNQNGQMVHGQRKINGSWYLFDSSTGAMKTGFQQVKDDRKKTVFYDKNGRMLHGQQKINGSWYLFDASTGAMKTGFQQVKDDRKKTVFYDKNGRMLHGQHKINGHWYLFDASTGAVKTGLQYIKNEKKTVLYNNKGQMLYGQQKYQGHWYLLNTLTGAMQTGFQKIKSENKTVYYNEHGQMLYGTQKINGKTYKFNRLLNYSYFSLQLKLCAKLL